MIKGIYTAAAGMVTQMIQADITADNLANINTPGFKTSSAQFQSFGEALISRMSKQDGVNPIGKTSYGSQLYGSSINFQAGDLVQTGNPLDLAIHGDGFFVVKPQGSTENIYTRAGNFTQSPEGKVITPEGAVLQLDKGEGQMVDAVIPKGARQIAINNQGELRVDGNLLGKIKVAQFEDPHALKRLGAATFSSEKPPLAQATQVTLEQGFIERSNGNAISELVNSMTGLRAYETMQKSISFQNQTLEKLMNEVGKSS